tara:strand:+ start:43 stop:258 length:216 start_codon:yes stop_codon:yes gene_type:complete
MIPDISILSDEFLLEVQNMKQSNVAETSETVGETSYTQWVNRELEVWWIPMMNPVYLTENNLWDDRTTDTK